MADNGSGTLEVGTNDKHEVVINLPRDMTGHIVFSVEQAEGLAATLTRTAREAQHAKREAAEAERIASLPPVDRTKLCTTDGRSPADARASQTNETGQHASYIVLCDEERAKGFVRPYRDRYKHVGRSVCLRYKAASDGFLTVCDDAAEHAGECFIDTRTLTPREHKIAVDGGHRLGGCGSVTTMGRALSETYARDPGFYGATFCCNCNRHLPVSEFVWTADGQQVGS